MADEATKNALRDRLLAAIWKDVRDLDESNVRNTSGAARCIDAGADPADVIAAMTSAAYEMAFGLVYMFTGTMTELDNEQAEDGWGLVDVRKVNGDEVAGDLHTFEGLYESLLTADPTGRDGRDFIA